MLIIHGCCFDPALSYKRKLKGISARCFTCCREVLRPFISISGNRFTLANVWFSMSSPILQQGLISETHQATRAFIESSLRKPALGFVDLSRAGNAFHQSRYRCTRTRTQLRHIHSISKFLRNREKTWTSNGELETDVVKTSSTGAATRYERCLVSSAARLYKAQDDY
jgi:hypothetical protein